MSQYTAAAIDKIIADNPHVLAGDPHTPPMYTGAEDAAYRCKPA